ncbi:ROK family transcriptional regulator [Herbiconiux flava]|uniref:Putative NBD/HSP70 family sugar kinase n=1 Tax=Herbiconiux flava TaxID=881268 RepID=A0A852SBD8_9MICO|nr:ROK family transcriptional regulator [Herbiconiux flava]NYD69712.1 putative NBD/HSP70 family sugar kinase [Herbiconiux flava]GLK16459.1 sugar kinase [Herbiconiux flava]
MSVLGTPRPVSAGVGNSNDQTRRHNLSTILTTLHHGGAQTRADLTRRLGLNRSTIAALVGELVDLGLAHETASTEHGGVGRPSPTVTPSEQVAAIAVNPDTDAIIIGLVGLGGVVHKRIRYETAGVPTVRETVNIVKAVIDGMRSELDTSFRIAGVGIAVPGLVRADTGVVTLAPHLDWHDEPLAELVTEALGYPATVTNDAKAGIIAESVYGAGRGIDDLVYVNGSASGIGGGVLVGGVPLRGAQGYAAELGHISVAGSGIDCHCGRVGCLETEVHLAGLLAAMGRDHLDADEFDQLLLTSSDPAVEAEITRQLDVLTLALADFVSVFNPSRILLGGFLGSLFAAHPERIVDGVRAASFAQLADELTIERAQLRSRLLVVGAAEIAFEQLLADPAGMWA